MSFLTFLQLDSFQAVASWPCSVEGSWPQPAYLGNLTWQRERERERERGERREGEREKERERERERERRDKQNEILYHAR